MKIKSIRLKNFKSFASIEINDISSMCVLVGANGVGKSSFLLLFQFLKLALKTNVHDAMVEIGGFEEVRTKGAVGPIEIEFSFEDDMTQKAIVYQLVLDKDDERIVVCKEKIAFTNTITKREDGFIFSKGKLTCILVDGVTKDALRLPNAANSPEDEFVEIISQSLLALSYFRPDQDINKEGEILLANFDFMAIIHLLINLQIYKLSIHAIRKGVEGGNTEQLSSDGSNLRLVLHNIHKKHPDNFNRILSDMKRAVPGVIDIKAESIKGQMFLEFHEEHFADSFTSHYVSDGTLLMLAYFTLLHSPYSGSIICIEEPEIQIYHSLQEELAEAFYAYTQHGKQVFITTHSPEFVNGTTLEQVVWLEKEKGYTTIKQAKDDVQVKAYMSDGDKMGYLWKQGFFGKVNP
ncbi:MAG: AAA family ATPase [Firmicutes bacterium]|nr:AAA family ATPase [Bacillota bacterium]